MPLLRYFFCSSVVLEDTEGGLYFIVRDMHYWALLCAIWRERKEGFLHDNDRTEGEKWGRSRGTKDVLPGEYCYLQRLRCFYFLRFDG